jgi:AraC family transcriptional regulator
MPAQSAIHPSDLIQQEWVRSSQMLQAGGLMLEHQVQQSGECAVASGLTHHLLVLELGYVPRQVFRMGKREYDGALHQGDILLIPAEVSLSGACETYSNNH